MFSIIIPAYNASQTIAACLKSLGRQTLPSKDYEVIVVDDGSTDETEEISRRFNIRYMFQPNQGPASARNRGAAEATGEIILFTDADCIPESNWIREMTQPFQNPGIAGVKGAYKTRQQKLAARFAQAEFEDRYDLLKKHRFIDMVDTYSAAFRKDVFLQMGGFDESFPHANNEDTELAYRLAVSGHKLVFNPQAIVFHTHPETFLKYLKIKFWRGYWRIMVYQRFPYKAVKDSYTPAVIKLQTMAMALSFLFVLGSVFFSKMIPAVFLCWGAILFSSLPFSLKTYKKDKIIGLIATGVVLARSAAFASGCLLAIAVLAGFKRKGIPGRKISDRSIKE